MGQLGLGCLKNKTKPALIKANNLKFTSVAAGNFSAAIAENGKLFVWGPGSFGCQNKPFNVGNNLIIFE